MAQTRGWRPMTAKDLDDVVAIASIGFPDHPEDRNCFASRLSVFPEGCFILDSEAGAKGYLITYPWTANSAPVLNRTLAALPDDVSVLYLHDLALHPDVRGEGWSRSAMDNVLALATRGGWSSVALVAVNEAVDFWRRHKFEVQQTSAMAAKLASYGADARYMVRRV